VILIEHGHTGESIAALWRRLPQRLVHPCARSAPKSALKSALKSKRTVEVPSEAPFPMYRTKLKDHVCATPRRGGRITAVASTQREAKFAATVKARLFESRNLTSP
jgi:hypothetical protein